MTTTRRMACTLIAGGMALLQGMQAHAAETYPQQKPITIIVPQAAGGASDVVLRIVAQKMSTLLKQSVVVDNRPGAGGNIGIVAAARAPADGYTLLFNVSSAHLVNPFLYKNPGFSPEKDFVPVAPFATGGMVLVAAPTFAPNNVNELIELAKAKPGELTFASAGNGTLNHLLGEMFNRAADVQITHIPYRGAPAAATDVMSGRVSIAYQALASSGAFIKGGKLKVLAVANKERLESLPGVPSIAETVPGFGETPWYGLFAPAATPPAIVAALADATRQALRDPAVIQGLASQGAKPYLATPAAFRQSISSDLARWKKIVEESGAHVD
ncbi:tripartite tricarboxylate transporter substrate binding protein [Variovorax sp. E3]|uniref:Bug family tripartite tricarboxylate transporter substrate binding protein n=1 Tax=Variovorax sp. E3 TaxID=1914993 RepID=UPI0018DDC16F|nr:tripartite tricarboxylate transporter substrate binding protein [Variovorax sp. E3]